MGDEDIGQRQALLQIGQEIDDLGLDRDVEGRDRLVGDDQLRLQRQGAGDADALALAAGELMGEAVQMIGMQAHQPHQLLEAPVDLGPAEAAMDAHGLGDQIADPPARVEGGIGILEHHLHLAPVRPELAGVRDARCRRRPGGSGRR